MNVLKSATKAQRMAALGVIIVAAAAAVIFLLTREETYRTISIEELSGITLVTSEGKDAANAYEGMHLYSGDDVAVQKESDMTMVLDMDKYVYAEPETHFWLECAGDAENSQTVIRMDAGSILNRIKDNLNEGEVYQVDTPNSTMAVRGTVFRVTVYRGEDDLVYTLVEVFEGKVQIDLKTEDGEYNGVSETFGPGESALIRGNSEFSEFVVGEDGLIKHEIAYKEIPQNTAKVLVKYIDEKEELCIGKELLMDYTELAEHKMETREGQAATCTEDGYEEVWCSVCNEVTETVALPALGHTLGDWEIILEPTCEEAGTKQKVCIKCGEVCEEKEVEALGHTQGEFQVLSVADCTHVGEQVAYCEVCEILVNTVITDALGHTAGESKVITNATCTTDGTGQVICSVCGEVIETTVISATGHNMGSWEKVRSSTCTEEGKKERVCSWCGYKEKEYMAKSGHSMVVDEELSQDASCTEAGLRVSTCSVCGATENKNIAAKGHDFSSHTQENEHVLSDDMREFIITCTCQECGVEDTITVRATVRTVTDGQVLPREIYVCSCGLESVLSQ